jgi:hypothetical protein
MPKNARQRFTACLMALLLGACAKSGAATEAAYCSIASPIYISKQDSLTDDTAKQILVHNEHWSRLCND